MELSLSLQKYLMTVYLLNTKKPIIHQIDIAIALGYSKASVSRAIHLLINQGYLSYQDKNILLTPLGRETIAQLIYKYQFFYQLLIRHEFSHFDAQDYALQLMKVVDDSFIQQINTYHEKIGVQL